MGSRNGQFRRWNETHDASGELRDVYVPVFERLGHLKRPELRSLDERLEATMREMGVTFDISRDKPWGRRPWYCDLLPQIFAVEEWNGISDGVRQRMRAYEAFLHDIYGDKAILHSGVLPIQPVLGSAHFQRAAAGLKPPAGAFLHVSGVALGRLPDGSFAVKHHYMSNASGISYMVQNRRALARVIPETFGDFSIHSISDVPIDILETLRSFSDDPDPTVALLSSGPGSAVYSEHSFLARRMGIPLVQGGDLLVLNDAVYLKTVSGLEKVEVIYSRISDQWLDPMVFRRDSLLGVPGLVHCIRKGSVVVVNGIGSQLADDRALLPFAAQIVRFYLGEKLLLKSLPTYWLGDIDQREMVLADLAEYTIRPLTGERIILGGTSNEPDEEEIEAARRVILQNASSYVAQPRECDADTTCFDAGKRFTRKQDHIVFALRKPDGEIDVFPGALTRVSTEESPHTASELGGGSKDTWVQAPPDWQEPPTSQRALARESTLPTHHVSSRVAEAFYWIGRYLERAHNLAVMIGVIEALELEELNPTERTLYKPVWNRILPPLEKPGALSRRNISSPAGRYQLCIDIDQRGSVVNAVLRATGNADSILECLSLEAWSVVSALRATFQKAKYRAKASQSELTASTRKLCEQVVQGIPQFFGTAQMTMVSDGGWAFCEIGQMLERSIITANAVHSIMRQTPRGKTMAGEHETEIRLSAFLRMLNSRDVYRRVYQMRIEPGPMLDLLWKNPHAPRSISRCLKGCAARLEATQDSPSPATARTLGAFETLLAEIGHTDWISLSQSEDRKAVLDRNAALLDATMEIHNLISDGFLNHQVHMRADAQPFLLGLRHAI